MQAQFRALNQPAGQTKLGAKNKSLAASFAPNEGQSRLGPHEEGARALHWIAMVPVAPSCSQSPIAQWSAGDHCCAAGQMYSQGSGAALASHRQPQAQAHESLAPRELGQVGPLASSCACWWAAPTLRPRVT